MKPPLQQSTTSPNEHHFTVPALTVGELAQIRDFVRRALTSLGCEGVAEPLTLAVDEVCANVAMHGFGQGTPGGARVIVRRSGTDAVIIVEDEGSPFDPADAPLPDLTADWEDRPVGGLGWFLVRQMVDEMHYEALPSPGGGSNRLTLTKRGVATAPPSVES